MHVLIQAPAGLIDTPVYGLLELAKRHGQLVPRPVDGESFSAKHLCAATRHAWTHYEHHFGRIELSDEDYLSALEAAGKNDVHPPADMRF